jgi:hypothetical protein
MFSTGCLRCLKWIRDIVLKELPLGLGHVRAPWRTGRAAGAVHQMTFAETTPAYPAPQDAKPVQLRKNQVEKEEKQCIRFNGRHLTTANAVSRKSLGLQPGNFAMVYLAIAGYRAVLEEEICR